jgi:hypothetical protein
MYAKSYPPPRVHAGAREECTRSARNPVKLDTK